MLGPAALGLLVLACEGRDVLFSSAKTTRETASPSWLGPPPTSAPMPTSPAAFASAAQNPSPARNTDTADEEAGPTPPPVRCAVIGDYGWSGAEEQRVAELVGSLKADYVLTTGDNNYPEGSAATIDLNIGQYFADYIYPYHGDFPSRATKNRFFPTLGNHDWETEGAVPYLDYFKLPGPERYYDVVLGDIHFFAIDSDPREPDGNDASSAQAGWLKSRLALSRSAFNVVAMHHPPYSSGPHGNTPTMQWPYAAWGADLVLAGHDHNYERIQLDGITYIVSGLGGAPPYSFGEPIEGSQVRYTGIHGTTLLDADDKILKISFIDVEGRLIDVAVLQTRHSAP
jgi:hypothetical protein